MMIEELISKISKAEKNIRDVLGSFKDNVLVIRDNDTFDKYIDDCIGSGYIAIDTETNNSIDPCTCKLMGLCLYAPGLKQAYIPVNHCDYLTDEVYKNQLSCEDIKTRLQRVLDSKIKIIMHNGKFDYEVIKCTCDIEVPPYWDTMIAASILDENENHGLKEQYQKHVNQDQKLGKLDKLCGDTPYAYINDYIFALYAATDSFMTYELYKDQEKRFTDEDEYGRKNNLRLQKLFLDIEMPMVVIAAEMELLGAKADQNYCAELKKKYENILKDIDDSISQTLNRLNPVIEHWRNSEAAQRNEKIYPVKTKKRDDFSRPDFDTAFPQPNDITGLKFRFGKRMIDTISDPVKLSSPKQLGVLFYEIFGAKPVRTRHPLGTGKNELEELKVQFNGAKYEIEQYFKGESVLKRKLNEEELEEFKCVLCKWYRQLVLGDDDEALKKGLKRIEDIIKFCNLLLQRREVEKLITTYLNVVPALANHWGDGKIRFHLNPLGARTGRFSSGGNWKYLVDDKPVKMSGMNSQNLPSKNHEIRLMFQAEPGRVFVGGDFGQQEPKLTAFLSGDPKMIDTFKQGKDIYAIIAQSIFGNKYEDNLEFFDAEKTKINLQGKENRSLGKTVILAIMYGMSASGLASKTDKSKAEAEMILKKVFEDFATVKKSIDSAQSRCVKHGYVEGLLGRRRRLPNIQKPKYQATILNKNKVVDYELLNDYLTKANNYAGFLSDKEFEAMRKEAYKNNILIISNEVDIEKAKRQCFNAMIQGSAATMTKKTMILINENQMLKDLDARIVFQIHDELILDCPVENAEKVQTILKKIMQHSVDALGITIPMKCDMVIENRWGESAMTEELRVEYEKLKGKENPFEELCKMFPNFPPESIKKVIEDNKAVLRF